MADKTGRSSEEEKECSYLLNKPVFEVLRDQVLPSVTKKTRLPVTNSY